MSKNSAGNSPGSIWQNRKSTVLKPGLAVLAAGLAIASHVAIPAEPDTSPDTNISNAATLSEADSWYPRTIKSDKGSMVVYAPQIDAWTDFNNIDAWVAFEISSIESDQTYVGSIHFKAVTDTDIATREILLHDIDILKMSIKGLEEDSTEYQLAYDGISALSRKIPLDLVLEYLPQDIPIADNGDLNTEPPPIFFSSAPALLLSVDTQPMFVPVGESGLHFVLNTNWDVLRPGDDGALYLCYEDAWLSAADITGLWSWADTLPAQFATLPNDANWANVISCLPDKLNQPDVPLQAEPTVFYATEPAELILLDGEPEWLDIAETGLAYAANTAQELFRFESKYYFLASGRWFRADDLVGSWVLEKQLPDAFQKIPAATGPDRHPKSYLRASVPGTREAWEAALVASMPRKAQIIKGTESKLEIDVNYAGEPTFAPIEKTGIDLAMNTSYQVLHYAGVYYLCYNAVWFAGSAPAGPWKYAESIPDAFSTIPPSSPAYNTTFVSIEGSDEESVEYAYTSGYEGMYVEDETVVQGTGYPSTALTITLAYGIYDGWWGYPYYPYYPWPPSYGYGSWYDPSTGRYGEAVVGYGPYGAAAGAAVYNPETGVYGRGQAVWDSDEFAGRGFAYNPNTDTSVARNRYIDFDDNEGWSQGVARRGDEWRYRESEWQDGSMYTEFESSYGTEGEVYRQREGDTITSKGTIEGENRSATFEGTFEDGQGAMTIDGSEGGSGELNRQLDDGQVTGSGEFTKDGKTIETDVTRTAQGVKREFETGEGGSGTSLRSGEDSGFVYESGSGDKYAGRNGEVYHKTDDGWAPVESPRGQASASRVEGSVDTQSGIDRTAREAGDAGPAKSQYSGFSNQLDRDYQNRQNGFDRYSRHRGSAGSRSRRGGMQRGRRR